MKYLSLNITDSTDTYIIDDNLSFSGQGGQVINFRWGNLETPADILTFLLPLIFLLAGLILFFMLIAGGFGIFVSAGNPEKIKKSQSMIINALVGFLIIFGAFWIIQLLEYSLGLSLFPT